jgi:hypothetical protein
MAPCPPNEGKKRPGGLSEEANAGAEPQGALGCQVALTDSSLLPELKLTSDLEPSSLTPAAQRVLAASAPKPAKLMAARGVALGLKPAEIATVVAALTRDADAEVASQASRTFQNLPQPVLDGALGSDLPEAVISLFARAFSRNHNVIEQLLRMPRIGAEALEHLADAADERSGELIATNENLLLKHPRVIEKLYMNKRVRMSTADRLLELAVRNDVVLGIPAFQEASIAIKNELIPEPTAEPTFDDVAFHEAKELDSDAAAEEDTHEVDDEGQERVRAKFEPLYKRIAGMTNSQKIRYAMVGDAAGRLLLLRDNNRLVAAAAAKSPALREPEVERVTASRNVSEEVLRIFALNRDFTRSHLIKFNLVSNPRTPFTFSSRLVPLLRETDLKVLSKSKNVSQAIAQAARQQLQRKEPKQK